MNTMVKKKHIKSSIPELRPIIIVNDFQAVGMLIVQSQSQALKVLKHFILTLQEENPTVTRIVINDDKNVPLVYHEANPRRTDSVHMK
jgi:glucokinase